MCAMSSRDRVLTTLAHEEPDRVPFIFGVDLTTGIMRRAYRALTDHLGIEMKEQYMYGTWRELGDARVDEEVLHQLGSDGRGVWDRKPAHVEERNRNRKPAEPYMDEFGVGQVETGPEEWFPGIHPFEEASLASLENFEWPDMDDTSCFEDVHSRATELDQANEFAIFAAPWLISPFERAMQLLGMERLLTNLVLQPEFAQALLTKLTRLFQRYLENFLDEMHDRADVIILADDLGTQNGLLISPQTYRQMLKPLHADLISTIRERARAKIFFHTDGDVFDLIDDLVEIGVDILNPIQTNAGKMADLQALKQRYGTQLSLCGAVDTQVILPHGSPSEVADEVDRVIRILGPGGGYMLASVHTITNDVPPENVVAMAHAVEEFGRYPLT
jgi:uroporphyrinogen decarboxylase